MLVLRMNHLHLGNILYSVWKEVSKLFQKIRMVTEEVTNFIQYLFNVPLLLLVRVENFQKVFVCTSLLTESEKMGRGGN